MVNVSTINNSIRIAHIVGKAVHGGVESVVLNYYHHVNHDKFQFDFFVDSDSTANLTDEVCPYGGRVIEIPPYQQAKRYRRALRIALKEGGYPIVHSHVNTLAALPLGAARQVGIPIRIAHVHATEAEGEFARNIAKHILRETVPMHATHLAACSRKVGRWAFGDRRYAVIENAIDTDDFRFDEESREAIRKRYDIGNGFVVGAVGRMVHVKNFSFLIDVFKRLKYKVTDSRLLFVGDGPLRSALERQALDLGLGNDVLFVGAQSRMAPFYSAMDVLCMPSYSEGFAMVLLEAQCSGLSAIASTNIPPDVNVTGTLRYLDLDAGPSIWAEAISSSKHADRGSYHPDLGDYDIEVAAVRLERLYGTALLGLR